VVVEETVRASPPSVVESFAHLDLLAISLLMASDHLVLVGLCLANSLWLEVAQLLCHFLKLEFADRRWREMVVQVDMVAVVQVWERAVSQPTLCHTCQDQYPEHDCL